MKTWPLAEDAPCSIRGTWSALHVAVDGLATLYRSATDEEREEIAVVLNALAAMRDAVTRGDEVALRKLASWTKGTNARRASRRPACVSTKQNVHALYLESVAEPKPAVTPHELARRIRLWLQGNTSLSPAQDAAASETIVEDEELQCVLLEGSDPGGMPFVIDNCVVRIEVKPRSRFDVALRIAGELWSDLAEAKAFPSEVALAQAICRAMPLEDSSRVPDRDARCRDEAFTLDAERTIIAAFKAAGFPRKAADNLFGIDAMRTARRAGKARSRPAAKPSAAK